MIQVRRARSGPPCGSLRGAAVAALRPLIVYNIGKGPEIEDTLFAFPITAHYRYRGE